MDQIKSQVDNLADLSDEQVAELQASIVSEFESVEGQEPTPQTVDAMTSLADMLDTVRGETKRREAATQELATQAAEAAMRVKGEEEVPADAEAAVEEAPEEEVGDAPEEEKKEDEMTEESTKYSTEAAQEATTTAEAGTDEPVADTEVPPTEETPSAPKEEQKEQAPVTASAEESFQAPADRQPVVQVSEPAPVAITAGADIPGYTAGSTINNLSEVASAMEKRIHSLRRVNGGDGEQHIVASFTTSYPEERTLTTDAESNWTKIQAVAGPEALVASGGHATPFEVKYDIFAIGSTTVRPIRDSLPRFQADRGGIRFITPPSFAGATYDSAVGIWTAAVDQYGASGLATLVVPIQTVAAASGGTYTITVTNNTLPIGAKVTFAGTTGISNLIGLTATVVDSTSTTIKISDAVNVAGTSSAAGTVAPATTKGSYTATAATENTVSTDAVTLQLQFGNLMSRAYPELIARHNELALVQHAREAEDNLLAKISAASLKATTQTNFGVSRDILVQVRRASTAYRSRHRIDPQTRLKVIMPVWVLDAMAADLALSMPGDGSLSKSRTEIAGYLADLNVDVIPHLDDSANNGVFGAQTDASTLTEFPDTFRWWLFSEGTFLFLDGGTLDLGIIRDSSLVGTNDYKMFIETFENIAKVGIESVQVTSTINVSGAAAALVTPSLTATANDL